MRARSVVAGVCLAVVSSAAVTAMPAPAWAGAGAGVNAGTGRVSGAADDAEKAWVRYLALSDPRSLVRIAAWQALLSGTPEEAVRQFLDSGYDYAARLSDQQRAVNTDFARRVLDTYPAEFSPAVHEAARRAVASRSAVELERFARSGFAEAKQRDSAARAAAGERARVLAAADAKFVRDLAVSAPGEQERVSAAYAVRAGATDADVVDFYAAGWGFGAGLDLDSHRRTGADSEARWRAALSGLLAGARAAEQASATASGEFAQQAKAKAAAAWHAVADSTGDARAYWERARRAADVQARHWADIASRAATAGANWDSVAGVARDDRAAWEAEGTVAAQQAGHWADVLTQAREGEARMSAA